MRGSDRGSITVWMLGLSLLILVFGGLALDYWRALAWQRELASVADSAAIAAASGIDEEAYRSTGELVLDSERSTTLALDAVAWQDVDLVTTEVDVSLDSVTVTLIGEVELGLLGVFVDQSEPLTVRASATAAPVLTP
jgi:Flp pilus assembly protein TadG